MKKVVSGITVECRKGDITKQPDLDAIVNAANAALMPGGGVSGAIHRAAGAKLYQKCKPLAPIKTGEAVITLGCDLPNKHVIHCLGPVYGRDNPSDKLLADCYRNALKLADKEGLKSVGFPAISTGIFGYPAEEAAKVAFKTFIEVIPLLKSVKNICFVLFDDGSLAIHEKEMLNAFKNS